MKASSSVSQLSTPKRAATEQTYTFSPSSIVPSISQILRAENGHSAATTDSTVQDAEFAAKKWIWVPDEDLGFIKAFVVTEDGDTLKVRCSDDSVSIPYKVHKIVRNSCAEGTN